MADNRPLASGFEDDYMARIDTAPAGEVQRSVDRAGLKVDSIGPDPTLPSSVAGEKPEQKTVKVEVQGEEASAIPGGARPLETLGTDQAAIEAANRGVVDAVASTGADEAVVGAGEDEQGEPVDVKVTDPNAEAHAAVEGVGKMGGETRLEELIGKPSADPKTPAEAPEISAFPEKRIDVPPARTVAPDVTTTSAQPVGAPDFASPYPLSGPKPAETTTGPAAPQTFINMSGLPGTPPPPVAVEPQIPAAPAEPPAPVAPEPVAPLASEPPAAVVEEPVPRAEQSWVEWRQEEDAIIDQVSELSLRRTELIQKLDKPLTDMGADLDELGKLDAKYKELMDKYQAIRAKKNVLDTPEAKSGEAS